MPKTIIFIAVIVGLLISHTAGAQNVKPKSPYFGQCRTAVMNQPGMRHPPVGWLLGTCMQVGNQAMHKA